MAIPKIALIGTETPQHRRRVAESINGIINFDFDDSRVVSNAEAEAGVIPTNLSYPELNALRYGAIGDGITDDTAACQRMLLVLVQKSGSEALFPAGHNFSISQLTLTSQTNFQIRVDGIITSRAAKPGGTGVDRRSADAGLYSPLKFDTCTNFILHGKGYIQNGYVEPLFFTACSDFDCSLDCRGNGTNDNLCGLYVRYCSQFIFHDCVWDAVTLQNMNNATEVYTAWSNNIQLWDCSGFTISRVTSRRSGMNGIYPGSNCFEFNLVDNLLEYNAGSGIQVAWSSFGVFPQRFSIIGNTLRNNQADGVDINNTSGSAVNINATVSDNIHVHNGYCNCNPANPAGADGSGVATFWNVNQFTSSGNAVYECARAGAFINTCNQFTFSNNSVLKTIGTSVAQGVYIEACANAVISGNLINSPSLEAFKVFGALSQISVSENYFNGDISFPTPSGTTTYTRVQFLGNNIAVPSSIQVACDWKDNKLAYSGNGNALTVVAADVTLDGNAVVAATAGANALVMTNAGGVKVINNDLRAANQALIVTNGAGFMIQGNYFESTGGATMQLAGTCDRAVVLMNRCNNLGAANSFRAEITTTLTSIAGNIVVAGPAAWLGTMQINFP